jgi:hypothetical protein
MIKDQLFSSVTAPAPANAATVLEMLAGEAPEARPAAEEKEDS